MTAGLPVEADGLSKAYGDVVAVHDVSLAVSPGEAVGLLGPNGAGKTTTVKMLVGLTHPSAGAVRLFGGAATDPQARARVGYLPELFRFPEWLSGRGVLDLHGRLVGLDRAERRERADEVLEQVGLADRAGSLVRGYSKGMSQRLGLAVALLARPALVLLDEPTSALDPLGRRLVRQVITDLKRAGVAVLLNSHLLPEVQAVCDRVVVLDRGRVRWSGPLDHLVRSVVELRVDVDRVDDGLVALLAPFGVIDECSDRHVRLHVADDDVAGDVAAAVVGGGYRLLQLLTERRSLEDAYVQLVSEGEQ